MPKGQRLDPDFWANVDVRGPDECWLWKWWKNRKGYGMLMVSGKNYKAHRRAYELTRGDIPNGLFVCHTCDNPPCCNPSHLWLGTIADNSRDMARKGRQAHTKLTPDIVRTIRATYADGGVTYAAIGARFGISESSIYRIVCGSRWKHID